MIKQRTSIKKKIVLIICIVPFVVMSVGICIIYFFGLNIFRDSIGRRHSQIAGSLADSVSLEFKYELDDAKTSAARRLWVDVVQEYNRKYRGMKPQDIEKELLQMDKVWVTQPESNPAIKEYFENKVALSIKDVVNIRPYIAELFITDKFGGLVAVSEKTTDFYQADEEWWQQAYDGGKGKIYVGNIEFDDSSRRWVLTIAMPIRAQDNSVIGVCKESIDIDRFFANLYSFGLGETGRVALTDEKGNILFYRGLSAMSEKIVNNEADFLKLIESRKLYQVINNLHIPKGKIFTVFSKITLPYLSEKGVYWVIFVFQDAKEAFQPLDAFVEEIIIATLILILILVSGGYFLSRSITKPIEKLSLLTKRVMAGEWDYKVDIKSNDEIGEFAYIFKQMVYNLKERQTELLEAKNSLEELSQGLERKVEERTKELKDVNDATLNILEDLTDAKAKIEKYSKELEDALKVKSDFTSAVSHELRTPLAAIKEGIAIVLDGIAGDVTKEQAEFLTVAKRNVDRLTRLINDILDFQRLEAKRMEFRMEENDIGATIKEVYDSMVSWVNDKNLGLILDVEKGLPKIKFDKDRIIQVLVNLVGNAVKAMQEGNITIVARRIDSGIEVIVQDTGIGISKEDLPKLFQQFEQLEKGSKRKTGGTGLGLFISKAIIEEHRGKIWVESELGKGSAFHFTLPFKQNGA